MEYQPPSSPEYHRKPCVLQAGSALQGETQELSTVAPIPWGLPSPHQPICSDAGCYLVSPVYCFMMWPHAFHCWNKALPTLKTLFSSCKHLFVCCCFGIIIIFNAKDQCIVISWLSWWGVGSIWLLTLADCQFYTGVGGGWVPWLSEHEAPRCRAWCTGWGLAFLATRWHRFEL